MSDGPSPTPAPRALTSRAPSSERRRVTSHPDLQALLADAVTRLADSTGATCVVAWGRLPSGDPGVLAARYDGPAPSGPGMAAYDAVAALPHAADLGAPGSAKVLLEIAATRGLTAAVPLRCGSEEPYALVLLGGSPDPPGRVRPRTLAALESLVLRLDAPAAALMARDRLSILDEEVKRLDRLAALGDLVAEIVHEIRNPLVSVKTFLQLLPERMEDPEFRQSFLDVASDELRRIERLLDVILEQARPRSSVPDGGTEVSAVLEAVVRLVSHRAADQGVALATAIPPGLPRVSMAPDALRQVALNLVLNAIEATPEGASIHIRVRRGERLELRIEDEGPGVPLELRERVFEPFFTTKPDAPGGLGLAISRRIVGQAGGTLTVEDRPGGGAAFVVRLPRDGSIGESALDRDT